eukprot:7778138-Pyramimonas_sp.AAC.1
MARRERIAAPNFPATPLEAFQIVAGSFRETVVRNRVARERPQGPPEGAQEASRNPKPLLLPGPQKALQGGGSAKPAEKDEGDFAG